MQICVQVKNNEGSHTLFDKTQDIFYPPEQLNDNFTTSGQEFYHSKQMNRSDEDLNRWGSHLDQYLSKLQNQTHLQLPQVNIIKSPVISKDVKSVAKHERSPLALAQVVLQAHHKPKQAHDPLTQQEQSIIDNRKDLHLQKTKYKMGEIHKQSVVSVYNPNTYMDKYSRDIKARNLIFQFPLKNKEIKQSITQEYLNNYRRKLLHNFNKEGSNNKKITFGLEIDLTKTSQKNLQKQTQNRVSGHLVPTHKPKKIIKKAQINFVNNEQIDLSHTLPPASLANYITNNTPEKDDGISRNSKSSKRYRDNFNNTVENNKPYNHVAAVPPSLSVSNLAFKKANVNLNGDSIFSRNFISEGSRNKGNFISQDAITNFIQRKSREKKQTLSNLVDLEQTHHQEPVLYKSKKKSSNNLKSLGVLISNSDKKLLIPKIPVVPSAQQAFINDLDIFSDYAPISNTALLQYEF